MNGNGSPEDFPAIEINGTKYRVKFGLGAFLRLEKMGVSLDDLNSALGNGGVMKNGNFGMLFSMLSATLGVEGADGLWHPISYTPEQLADLIPVEQLGIISEAISASASKVSTAAMGAGLPETTSPPLQ